MTQSLGIILHGATGRICSTQHLANALAPIRAEGGLDVNGGKVVPEILLAGRNEAKLKAVAAANGAERWTTDLDAALEDSGYPVFFEAAATHLRPELVRKALAAGKHVYAEKPLAPSSGEGKSLLVEAERHGLRHGAVEDKRFLPGFRKLGRLVEEGFFGRILAFKLDFGWWIYDGISEPAQRGSWNYKKSGGGGLVFDMYPHWRYVVEGLLGPIAAVQSSHWTAQTRRADEAGAEFDVDVEDSAATLVRLASGAHGVIQSSWATRVRRDDMVTLQIDGTDGSAVAGLRRCWVQPATDKVRLTHFNMGRDSGTMDDRKDHFADWREFDPGIAYVNPYRPGWEGFIPHVLTGAPFFADFAQGIRDVEFAEVCMKSHETGAWVEMPPAD